MWRVSRPLINAGGIRPAVLTAIGAVVTVSATGSVTNDQSYGIARPELPVKG